jgi:hypothetical protein
MIRAGPVFGLRWSPPDSRKRRSSSRLAAKVSFRLQSPVAISTEKGEVAFQPVRQGDYRDQDAYANAPRRRAPGPGYPPPYYYYGYCGPWGWDCYPGPYFGPYIGWGVGVWGFGPRFGGFGRFRR